MYENEEANKVIKRLSFRAERLEYLLDIIFGIQKHQINTPEERTTHQKKGAWEFIPIRTGDILSTFYPLQIYLDRTLKAPTYRYKFLDAGCGIGNVLLLARAMGLAGEYHGLELFPKTHKAAVKFVGEGNKDYINNIKIIKKDILKFKSYADYDIIYYFHPLRDPEKEIKFEKKIENEMKVGAILIPRLKRDFSIEKDPRFEKLQLKDTNAGVWRKVGE
jgi:SAM-dependent methyltransferase